MSRKLCFNCERPERACICDFTVAIANETHVAILQHPSEVSQSKGTVALLAKSLQSCQVIVGEDFSANNQFLALLKQYQLLLLYPGEKAQALNRPYLAQLPATKTSDQAKQSKPLCLLILDGTWKKVYRMFMLSNKLQQLPQVCLPDYLASAGQYHIRKVAKNNALSSLEACCYALAMIEQETDIDDITASNVGKYQPLIEKFIQFNQFQLSFRPDSKI